MILGKKPNVKYLSICMTELEPPNITNCIPWQIYRKKYAEEHSRYVPSFGLFG